MKFHKVIIPIFFGIKCNEKDNIFEEKPVILKLPFVFLKPINFTNIYKHKDFIFYYSQLYYTYFDKSIISINYTGEEWNSMSV